MKMKLCCLETTEIYPRSPEQIRESEDIRQRRLKNYRNCLNAQVVGQTWDPGDLPPLYDATIPNTLVNVWGNARINRKLNADDRNEY